MTDTAPFTVDAVAPERLSMSFFRAAEGCLRRAHHERQVDATSTVASIGRLFHEAVAAVGFACSMRGDDRPDPAEAERIARRTMRRPEDAEPLSKEAWDEVLSLVRRWAPGARFRPGEQFEVNSRQPLDGRTLSARIDRLAVDGPTAFVLDYKTGWGDPASHLTLQGEVYAWHAFRLHPDIDLVVYEEEHVRHGNTAGPWEINRWDAETTAEFLSTAIERIDAAYAQAGELPANPGSACSRFTMCPVADTCPVPEWARPDTKLTGEHEALDAFRRLLVIEAEQASIKSQLRGWLTRTDRRAIQHDGQEYGVAAKPGSSFDKKQLATDLAAEGRPVDLDAYAKATSPTCGRRKAS